MPWRAVQVKRRLRSIRLTSAQLVAQFFVFVANICVIGSVFPSWDQQIRSDRNNLPLGVYRIDLLTNGRARKSENMHCTLVMTNYLGWCAAATTSVRKGRWNKNMHRRFYGVWSRRDSSSIGKDTENRLSAPVTGLWWCWWLFYVSAITRRLIDNSRRFALISSVPFLLRSIRIRLLVLVLTDVQCDSIASEWVAAAT